MIPRFLHSTITVSHAIIIFGILFIATILATAHFRQVIYSYEITLQDGDGAGEKLQFGSWPELGNVDFFNTVRDKLVHDHTSFIEANLSTMKLTVYLDGVASKELPILTKGREGSWWETPAGLYRIEGKEKNHFSGFAGVYLPWSMPFQGNFFIHGWPYYPGGDPVRSSYSGGCIRLSTEDAEEVFGLVKVGMPVLVFEDDFASDNARYESKIAALTARAYLAADLGSNFVFTEKLSDAVVPIASITKLVTALVAVEYVNIERDIEITEVALATTSVPRLKANTEASLYDLLHLLLLESSNEAAEAIANSLGRTRFIGLMNEKARAIGMSSTHFVDPSGRSGENVSTAQDLFALSKYLYNNRSFILRLTAGDLDTAIYGIPRFPDLQNFNLFGHLDKFVGGKVGLSQAAGETFVGVFKIPFRAEARPVVVVLLNSVHPAEEVPLLLDWIQGNFTTPEAP